MSHYFLVSAIIVRLHFCNCGSSHGRSCDRLVAHGASLHLTNNHDHSHLVLACLTQRWQPLPRTHEFQSGGYTFILLTVVLVAVS